MYGTIYALNNINCHQSLFNPSVILQVKSEQTGEPYYFTKETCFPTRLFTTIFSKVVMDISCTLREIRSVIGYVNCLDSQSDGGWIIEQRETLLTDHYFGQPVWRLQQLLALYIVKLSTVRYMCWWEAIIGSLFANELHQVDNIKLHFHDC